MTDVIMPQMGESIAEGTIIKWYKKEGDAVERDEPLFEISTDKVDTEIPSPVSGVLTEIKVPEGETVAINTVVAVIGDEGAGASSFASARASAPAAASSPASASPPASAVETASSPAASASTPAAATSPSASADAPEPRSSPLVRKMAKEHGIDLAQITGTGRGGRISKQDVLRFLETRASTPASPASPASPPEPARAPAAPPPPPPPPAAPAPPQARAEPAPEAPRPAAEDSFHGRADVVPMSAMRRSIAEHMIDSRRTSAHVTTVFEADVSRIVQVREAAKGRFEAEEGVKLTYTPFFVRAVTSALKHFPLLNASVDGDNIVYKKEYNIGVAVALEGGLIVPVIHRADEKSFLGLARAVADLAERARTKKLRPEDVQGGTFTLTNPGPYGGLFGTPIINQPQVAILGLGGIHKRPVVVNDAIAVRSMVYLALSFDHRLIDGALGDQFMADVKRRLESWDEKVL